MKWSATTLTCFLIASTSQAFPMKVRDRPNTSLHSYSVGIVGATGAVGKEIRQCITKREFPLGQLRIFGSERSAGKEIDGITVELFDVDVARQCDVVFLAVSGDFAKQHAKALTEGEDGCVCIDNSVRTMIHSSAHPHRARHTHHGPSAVCVSVQTRSSFGGARDQWRMYETVQVDCQPQLYDCDWIDGPLATP